MDKKNTYLTTGEFAKVCGANKQKILYYDQINLLRPAYRDSNGRRYYQIYHHDLFYLIEILQDMGMSLRDIKAYLDKRTPRSYLEKIKEQRAAMLHEIEKLKHAEKLIAAQIRLEENKSDINFDAVQLVKNKQIDICLSDQIFNFTSIEKAEKLKQLINKLKIEDVNIGKSIGSIVLKDSILNGQFENHAYYFVIDQPLFTDNVTDKKQLSGHFLVGYHRGDYNYISNTYQNMLDYMKKHNLLLGKYAFENIIYGTIHENTPDNYITEISMNIESE